MATDCAEAAGLASYAAVLSVTMAGLCGASRGQVHHSEHVLLCEAGEAALTRSALNGAHLSALQRREDWSEDDARLLRRARSAWLPVGPDLDTVMTRLREAGFTGAGEIGPVMTLGSGARRVTSEATPLQVSRASGEESEAKLRAVLAILQVSFPDLAGLGLATFRRFLLCPAVTVFLGTVNGSVVSTATTVRHTSDAGIFFVATSPSARKQGYGSAVTAAATQDAQRQSRSVSLQTKVDNHDLYAALGFEEVGNYRRLTLAEE